MRKHIYDIVLISFALASCSSHNANKTEVNNAFIDNTSDTALLAIDELSKFIPEGFLLISDYTADLNLDSIPDKLILLGLDSAAHAKMFPDSALDDGPAGTYIGPRPLIVLIRNADNSLKQVARNDQAVFEESATNYGGDAFQAMDVSNGEFMMEYFYHAGGEHSSFYVIFKYNRKLNDWILHETNLTSTSNTPTEDGSYDDTETETKTKKDFGLIRFKDYKGNAY